jgi:hypothetical protein
MCCGESEMGKCDICKKDDVILERKYYEYDIKCECHRPNHVECVKYCKDCTPVEPEITTITISTEYLKRLLIRSER